MVLSLSIIERWPGNSALSAWQNKTSLLKLWWGIFNGARISWKFTAKFGSGLEEQVFQAILNEEGKSTWLEPCWGNVKTLLSQVKECEMCISSPAQTPPSFLFYPPWIDESRFLWSPQSFYFQTITVFSTARNKSPQQTLMVAILWCIKLIYAYNQNVFPLIIYAQQFNIIICATILTFLPS